MSLWPLTVEILITFTISAYLLYKYGNWNTQNILTTVSVFIAWFFSFIVIFILPLDISNTSYQQCVADVNLRTYGSVTRPPIKYNVDMGRFEQIGNASLHSTVAVSILNVSVNSSDSTGNVTSSFNSSTARTTTIPATIPSTTEQILIFPLSPCETPWSLTPFSVMTSLWRIVYWTAQVLTWLVLPMMQSYSMAGDFTRLGKLRSAFIENAIYYGSFGLIFSLLLIYVVIHTSLDWYALKFICITASNTWGLLLLVVLLGYGLIEIPRSCYNTSLYDRTLSYLYFKVAKLSAEKCETQEKLEDVLEDIQQVYISISASGSFRFKQYLEIILQKCPVDWRKQLVNRYENISNSKVSQQGSRIEVNEKTLTRIHQAINRSVQAHRRIHVQWDYLVKRTIDWEDVSRNETNPLKAFKSTIKSHPSNESEISLAWFKQISSSIYTPKVEWYWKCSLRPKFFRCLSFITFTFSLVVIWSELTFSIQSQPVSLFALVFREATFLQCYLFIELMSIIFIAYLCVCTYYTVFKIRIFNYFYLASHHQTDEYSLIFAGMLFCRLTSPLCLNFLSLLHLDSHITNQSNIMETAFTHIMGHMDAIPWINGFNLYLPIIMCIFCLATFFQFGSRLLHFMGIEQFIVSGDEVTAEMIREGQELIKREKSKLVRREELNASRVRYEASENANSNNQQSRYTSVSLPVDNEAQTSSTSSISKSTAGRSAGRDSSKVELLTDIEPIDYSTWSKADGSSFKPQKNIFDDI